MAAKPLRIACIGRAGQAAEALAALGVREGLEVVRGGRESLDLKDDASLTHFIEQARADLVINAAAYNFVDKAEIEPDLALRINAEGPAHLARECRRLGLPFIHMSTDCVFDGAKTGFYDEEDEPNPLSAYGRSKLAGEDAVAGEYPQALTVRVCWVFSEYGDSFVSKMLEFARTRPVLRVVSDQFGPPTYAGDIAAGLIAAARVKLAGENLEGLLHIAAPEIVSRLKMTEAIMAESKNQGGPVARIEGITTAEFAAAAARPLNARLSAKRATERLGLVFTPFPQALKQSVRAILAR